MYKGSKLVSNFKDGEELFIWSFEDIPHLDSTAATWDKHPQQASQTGKLRLNFQISVPIQSLINLKNPKTRAPKFRDNSDLKTDREDLRRSEKIMNPPIIHLGHQRTAPNEVDRVAGPTFPWRLRPHHPVVEIIPSEHWMVYFMGNHNLKWMI